MKKIYTLLLVFFSFLVGFTACDDGSNNKNDEDNDSTLYGCIGSSYSTTVTGNIMDKNGNPVQNIKVTYKYIYNDISYQSFSSSSDEKGNYYISDTIGVNSFDETVESLLTVEDVDGEANGSFETQKIENIELNCTATKDFSCPDYDYYEYDCKGNINITLKETESSDDTIPDEDTKNYDEDAFTDEDTVNDGEITDEDSKNDTDNNYEEVSDGN